MEKKGVGRHIHVWALNMVGRARGRVVRLRRNGHSYPLIAHLGGSWRETEKASPVLSCIFGSS